MPARITNQQLRDTLTFRARRSGAITTAREAEAAAQLARLIALEDGFSCVICADDNGRLLCEDRHRRLSRADAFGLARARDQDTRGTWVVARAGQQLAIYADHRIVLAVPVSS